MLYNGVEVNEMFSEKLKKARIQAGYSQKSIAAKLFITQQAYSRYENGTAFPNPDVLYSISEILSVSIDRLLDVPPRSPSEPRWIPVLGRVEAGIPFPAIEDVIDEEQLSPDYDTSFEYVGLQIHGASMEPRMKDGDVVIVRIQDDVDDGDIAVVFVNGDEATIKKIKKTLRGISLIPLNPAFEPMFFPNSEIESLPVRIFGKVVELRAKF